MIREFYTIDGDGKEFLSRLNSSKSEEVYPIGVYAGDIEGERSVYHIVDATVIVIGRNEVQVIANSRGDVKKAESKMEEICRTDNLRLV